MAGEGYVIALTEEQKQKLRAATDIAKLTKAYREISRELAEAQLGGVGLDNVWDESGKLVRADALPEDQEVAIRFPGVDPRGRYSVLDMKVAERLERINSTLALRGEPAKRAIRKIMHSDAYQDLSQEVQDLAKEQRVQRRAEKLSRALAESDEFCPLRADYKKAAGETVARNMHQWARDKDSAQAVVDMDLMLQSMETMLGIRIGPIPQEIQTFCAAHRLDLSPATIEECRKPVLPEGMTIEFPDFVSKQAQLQFAKPENWGKQPKDYAPLTPEEIGVMIPPYIRASAGRALDAMFSSVEATTYMTNMTGDSVVGSAMDRADYLCIGGKTVSQILTQRYRDGEYPGYRSYGEFLRRAGHQSVAELVSAALTAGRSVDAYIPDARGDIPAEPVRLTQHGFEPSRLDPVTMNLWERFWSKFGFYREKTAQVEAQVEAQEARAEARARVQLHHSGNRTIVEGGVIEASKDDFFREWKETAHKDKLPTESVRSERVPTDTAADLKMSEFSLSRSAWTTFAKLEMLKRGYPLADIVDPNKLQEEKQAVGTFLIDKIAAKNPPDARRKQEGLTYLCDLFYDGARKYVEQIDLMARGYDLSDPKTYTSPEFFTMLKALDFGYDGFQEAKHVEKEFRARYGGEAFTRTRNLLGTYGILERGVADYYDKASELLRGNPTGDSTTGILQGYVSGAARIRRAAEAFAANPGKAFSEVFTEKLGEELVMLLVKAGSDPRLKIIQGLYDTDRDFHAQFDQAILAGDMPSRLKLPDPNDPESMYNFDKSILAPAIQAQNRQEEQAKAKAKTEQPDEPKPVEPKPEEPKQPKQPKAPKKAAPTGPTM